MKKSALQQARAAYQPKLPIVLTGAVKAVEGDPTQSVADQEDIKNLFPNTYGLPELKFEKNANPVAGKPLNVGVIDRKSTRLNSSHTDISRMPSSA